LFKKAKKVRRAAGVDFASIAKSVDGVVKAVPFTGNFFVFFWFARP
jgi:hypothetical protein